MKALSTNDCERVPLFSRIIRGSLPQFFFLLKTDFDYWDEFNDIFRLNIQIRNEIRLLGWINRHQETEPWYFAQQIIFGDSTKPYRRGPVDIWDEIPF